MNVVRMTNADITAMVVPAKEAVAKAQKRIKSDKFTKAIVVLMADDGRICYECGNMRREDMIASLEIAKMLLIRDSYGNA